MSEELIEKLKKLKPADRMLALMLALTLKKSHNDDIEI